jgi:1,4-alpha-glucan branching enzyme
MSELYQWEKQINAKPKHRLSAFSPDFGAKVITRDKKGHAEAVEINIYTGDYRKSLYVIGPFNKWGEALDMKPYKLESKGDGYQSVILSKGEFKHKTPYLMIDSGVVKRDPATTYFDKEGRSVFWDFKDPNSYSMKHNSPSRKNRSVRILQSDLHGLISHFRSTKSGELGHEVPLDQNYRFISESGVIEKIASLGFNAIQFLPVSQSIDGGKWSFRYLVPYLFAINNSWGTPDEFAEMVDNFHKQGISVILDHVISHVPNQRFRLFDIPNRKIGIHRWTAAGGEQTYLGDDTSWGTKRYRFDNATVRRFIVQSAIKIMSDYGIDGYRVDNVDGILRHGENGDGSYRDGGRELLRELNQGVYDYDPLCYMHFESHYFSGENAKLLTLDLDTSPRALGATAYTSSRLTHFFHQEFMPKSAESISPWQVKDIIDEKEWGMSNSTVADFHNHDAAAGLMSMRATGSYAYDALILNDPSLHFHAVGKIKVMEALISFGMEGRTLDLLQTHLLQTGTFEHDSTIHWANEQVPASNAMLNYKSKVNEIMEDSAFWFESTSERKYINIDAESKSLVIYRKSLQSRKYVIFVNMSSTMLFDFQIPVESSGDWRLVMNSDSFEYAGSGQAYIPEELITVKTSQFEFYSHALEMGSIPPYAVLVFAQDKS